MAQSNSIKHKGWKWSTADASNPTLVMALDDTSKAVHVADASDASADWNVSADSYPSLYIHTAGANVATDYIKMYHDDTDAYIDAVGATALNLLIAGTNILDLTATALSPSTTDIVSLGTTLLNWSDLFLDSGAVINFNNGEITLTHSETGKLAVAATWATAGATGRPFHVTLTTDALMGSYVNAIKGSVDLSDTGCCSGLFSVINAEMTMAAGAGLAGTYALYEAHFDCPTSWAGTNSAYYFWLESSGTTKANFDTYGSLWTLRGLTAASGKMLYNQTIRFKIEDVNYYLPYSTTTGTFTFGADAGGLDAKFFGALTGYYLEWDASANSLLYVGDLAVNASSGSLACINVGQTISGNVDCTGTYMMLPIFSYLNIEGHTSTTLWSSTSPAACLGGWVATDNTNGVSQTNGHLLAGWFTVAMGQYYVGSGGAYVAGLLISSETHASATMNSNYYSAIRVMKNTGKLDWIQAFDISDCTSLLRIEDDETVAADRAVSPLTDIQGTASTGFIRVLVGNTVRYIALYTAN